MLTKSGVIDALDFVGNIMYQESPHVYYLPEGDYIFRVAKGAWRHSNIDYKFNIKYERNIGNFESEHNNSHQTATPIQINKPITGNIFPRDDVDFYKFDVSARSDISIKFNHDFINDSLAFWNIKVLSATNGQIMEFNS
jgi:hypothetical protein